MEIIAKEKNREIVKGRLPLRERKALEPHRMKSLRIFSLGVLRLSEANSGIGLLTKSQRKIQTTDSLLPTIYSGYRKVVRICVIKYLTRLEVENVENILVGLNRKRDKSNRMPRQNHSKINWMERNSKANMQNCNMSG